MHHQVLADQPRRIRQAIRKPIRLRHEQQAWRADPVAADDDDLGALLNLPTISVDVDGASRKTFIIDQDLTDARAGDELCAVSQGVWPMRMVCGGLGLFGATGQAGAAPDAGIASVIVFGRDRIRARPPVPSQLVHSLGCLHPDLADGQRGQGQILPLRIGRVSSEPGHTHLDLHLFVEGFEIFVREGPVVRNAV